VSAGEGAASTAAESLARVHAALRVLEASTTRVATAAAGLATSAAALAAAARVAFGGVGRTAGDR